MSTCFQFSLLILSLLMIVVEVPAADWTQFRGPQLSGVSQDTSVPTKWSDKENLKWRVELPGAGSASPIVLGDQVFVSCYSGYGVPKETGGSKTSLQRQLVSLNRKTGKIEWTKSIRNESPEDDYQGFISEHGYASNTPVTDGERVYCFCGKSGVLAFDLKGNQLWQTSVGKSSSNRRWGSAASLILYKDLVIVNASEESQSIRALNKQTGKEQWKAEGGALELAYGTPNLVTLSNDRTDLVLAMPGEIWGVNPDNGKLRWYAEHLLTGNISPSVLVSGEQLFVYGGFQSAGSFSMKAGGKGDVGKSQLLWSSRASSYVATPVLHEGYLYWINDRGQAFCQDAKTGKDVYQKRVTELTAGGRPVYASPVLANGHIYVQSRWNGVLVFPAKPEYQVLAQNEFKGDETGFNATPAISNGEIFLRSDKSLYCVGKK